MSDRDKYIKYILEHINEVASIKALQLICELIQKYKN